MRRDLVRPRAPVKLCNPERHSVVDPIVRFNRNYLARYYQDSPFLRLYNVDLYEPIRDSLLFFFPRLVPGGVIVVDDYGTTDWPGVAKAVEPFLAKHQPSFFVETLGSMIIVK